MKLSLSSSPHQRVKRDTAQVMRMVIYAMLPGMIAQSFFFGWGMLIQAIIAVVSALVIEGVILFLRNRPIERTLTDYSAVLTGLLIAISIPPTLPWWMTVTGLRRAWLLYFQPCHDSVCGAAYFIPCGYEPMAASCDSRWHYAKFL